MSSTKMFVDINRPAATSPSVASPRSRRPPAACTTHHAPRTMLWLLALAAGSFVVIPNLTHAMTAEQKAAIHEHFETIGAECVGENPITEDDIASLRARELPAGEHAACFLACVFKRIGVMDDKGMLQKESVLELAKKVFDDAEELKAIENYLHSCSHINSAPVSDGAAGCERALLSYTCMTEHAAQFGFEV